MAHPLPLRPLLARLLPLCAAFGSTALAAQSPDPMALNRVGRWAEAAEVSRGILAKPAATPTSHCEARTHLVSALSRLGRADEAGVEIAGFERACTGLPAGHWARGEIARARDALASGGARARGSSPAGPAFVRPAADDWPVASPTALRMDTAALAAHRRLCSASGADACVVVHRGSLVDEWYGPRYAEPIGAMSSTKSVTGLLAGMLVGDGKLSTDHPVSRYIPEWRAGAAGGVTVRHLLSMTSGLPDFPPGVREVGSASDKEAFTFGLGLVARPGASWAYSNDGAFLLSPLLDRAAGEPIEDYARRRLFGPLGMRTTRLYVYPEGQAWTHADMQTTARDLARVGQLMLNGGRWGGVQIVPEEWVRESVRPSQPHNPRYGLLWWIVPDGYAAFGYLDTNVYVFPERDLVVVRMQSKLVEGATRYEPAAYDLFARMTRK
ncbi:MAG TPA: serine hydrolase [Longimicrobium sp.]|jgi:CubicO group peptidase (beta-lactamase class C family)